MFIRTVLLAVCWAEAIQAADPALNRQLIVACHRVDVDTVVRSLRDGADVNARYGRGDVKVFRDLWSNGWPLTGEAWTPLMALASASNYPDPPRAIANTIEDLNWAQEQRKTIPAGQLQRREQDRLTILSVLLSHKANIDMDDGYGATALFEAVDHDQEEFALRLLRFGAKVNTKTGVYIDGPGNITPLHRACRSPTLTKALLKRGADPDAKDSTGETPRDWAGRSGNLEVLKLYER